MAVDNKTRYLIRKYSVKNAFDYGKAAAGSVLGKVVHETKGVPVQELKAAVEEEIALVNRMRKAELDAEYAKFSGEFEAAAREKAERTARPAMTIEGAERGRVVTRHPPEPGGYMHLGNAKQCLLSDEVARLYDGKIYLYFDDTNPEKCKQEYVEGFRKDTGWLGVKFDKEYYASDNIEKIYGSARKLLEGGEAYVCMCSADEIKKGRAEKRVCRHRRQGPKENAALFEGMLGGKYGEGQAVVRLKADMKADNPTFRDPTLLRINRTRHYRQGNKYIVWPTYHLNTPVMDHLYKVTDVIRDKNYEIWDSLNKKMLESLGVKPPRFHYEARLGIIGNTTAKRVMRKLIKDGSVSGWDDPRLLTIAALRRRGIEPKAIREFILRFGMSKTDSKVPMEMLLAENKRLIEPKAKHLYFVAEPVKLRIRGSPGLKASMPLHPSTHYRKREYETKGVFYISKDDASGVEKGARIRLKDLADIVVTEAGRELEGEVADGKGEGKIIQWVSSGNFVRCSVMVILPILDKDGKFERGSLKTIEGYVESYAENLEERDIVQFERFGYCILDNKDKMQFIFISR